MTNTPMTFDEWWKSDGQYVRSGGGDYEKSFAYEAWQQNQAVIARLKRVIQSYEGEVSVNENTIAELVEALEKSMVALDDWLNMFASEFCKEDRVKEAFKRITEKGTIGYIADVQEINRKAIAKVKG